MSSLTEAQSLSTSLQGHLTGFDCQVTLDPTSAGGSLAAGSSVLVLTPPSIEYVTATEKDYSWEALLASGPTTDRVEAWEDLDAILEVLEGLPSLLNLSSATPAEYSVSGGYEYAAYILRFTS